MRLGLAVLLSIAGCAGGAPVRPHLAAVVMGTPDERAAVERALVTTGAEADVRVAALPSGAPLTEPDASAVADRIAAARAAYESGEYEACAAELAEPTLLERTLEARDRDTAARLCWWRAACARASSGPDAAREPLATMARLELARPAADVEAVAASIDVQLADLRAEIAAALPATLTLSTAPDARVTVDGAPRACAGACTVTLAPGSHHLSVSADGRLTHARWVDVSGETSAAVTLEEAAPEIAAGEWLLRYAGEARDGEPSVALLRRALRAERLVLVSVEGARLRGVLSGADGIEARAERMGIAAPLDEQVRSLLFELAPWARPEPWWETPWPWIVLGAVLSGAAAGITYYYAMPISGPSTVRLGVMP